MKRALVFILSACCGDQSGRVVDNEFGEIVGAERQAVVLPEGSFFGTGAFSAFFLDGDIQRPFPAHWQVTKLPDGTYELLGDYPIVNSQTIFIRTSGHDLLDATGKKRGDIACKSTSCHIDFDFESNSPLGGRAWQKLKVDWSFDSNGFLEDVKLSFRWLPVVGTVEGKSSFVSERP